jgi:hypothetical protein
MSPWSGACEGFLKHRLAIVSQKVQLLGEQGDLASSESEQEAVSQESCRLFVVLMAYVAPRGAHGFAKCSPWAKWPRRRTTVE